MRSPSGDAGAAVREHLHRLAGVAEARDDECRLGEVLAAREAARRDDARRPAPVAASRPLRESSITTVSPAVVPEPLEREAVDRRVGLLRGDDVAGEDGEGRGAVGAEHGLQDDPHRLLEAVEATASIQPAASAASTSRTTPARGREPSLLGDLAEDRRLALVEAGEPFALPGRVARQAGRPHELRSEHRRDALLPAAHQELLAVLVLRPADRASRTPRTRG